MAKPTTFQMQPHGPFDLMNENEFFGGWPVSNGGIVLTFPVEGWKSSASVVMHQEGLTIIGSVYGTDDAETAWLQALAVLSLDVDGEAWPEVGQRDPILGKLQREFGFLRPVLFHSPYESAAAFIIGHRISIKQGRALRARMAEQLGDPINTDGTTYHAFPRPELLAQLDGFPGLSEEKVRRLHGVAHAAQSGWLERSALHALSVDDALTQIKTLRGIGEFFAQGVLTRGAGIQDWLSQDAITAKAIATAYGSGDTARKAEEISDSWRPFRMWSCVLLHVWARRTQVATGARQ